MGLRAASVRHSNATVMAPALTEANQAENFKLAKSSHLQIAVNGHSRNGGCSPLVEERLMCKELESMVTKSHTNDTNNANNIGDALENLNTLAFVSEIVKVNGHVNNPVTGTASDTLLSKEDMNHESMGDQSETMGLHAQPKEMSPLLKDKQGLVVGNDVDQLLLHNVIQGNEMIIGSTNDLGTNVDDIMQVLKHIESGNGHGQTGVDNAGDTEIGFPISTVNLSSFCQNFLNDDIGYGETTEEQLTVDQDAIVDAKEVLTQEKLEELKKMQLKLERRYEFLLRRLQKIQARGMAQHMSGEVAGLFEFAHRLLKRPKPQTTSMASEDSIGGQPETENSEVLSQLPTTNELPSTSNAWPSETPKQTLSPEKIRGLSFASMKNLIHKLEKTKQIQSNASHRSKTTPRYFGAGSMETSPSVMNNVCRNNCITVPSIDPDSRQELERVSGLLETEIGVVQRQIDSDATVSSSGAESCDEMQNFNNPHQQYCTIAKRASWKYAQERAAIASRWTWVQWQISDLEYRIRQLNELHKQIRNSKGPVVLGNAPRTPTSITSSPGSVNGYRGLLPGQTKTTSTLIDDPSTAWLHNGSLPSSVSSGPSSSSNPATNNTNSCARTKPLVRSVFRNRRLLQTTGLHVISKKWRPSSVRCNCVPGMPPCALCTGRTDPTYPKESRDLTTVQQQIGYLDAGYHPKISFPEDVNQSFHYDALLKMPEWQQKTARSMTKALKLAVKSERLDKTDLRTVERRLKKPEYRRKYNKLLKASTASALSAKIKNRIARGRKPNRAKAAASLLTRLNRKRPADVALAQLQALSGNEVDNNDAMDVYDNNSGAASGSKHPSPASSPPPVIAPERIQFTREYRRNRIDSYDIDNIVIPYSVAASTRVEKLPYKEILTPKWRVHEIEPFPLLDKNNGLDEEGSHETEEEDISDEIIMSRHEKCEVDERKKFMSYIKFPLTGPRSRANRRTDSRAESSGANTPDPMSPHTGEIAETSNSPLTSPPATPMAVDEMLSQSIGTLRRRTISQSRWAKERENREETTARCSTPDHVEVLPYDSREFPLSDETYEKMLGVMPEGYAVRLELKSEQQDFISPLLMDSEETSTDSVLGEEDPNDPEWMVVKRMRDRPKR